MKTKIKAIILSCLTVASFAISGIGASASGTDGDDNAREITGVSNTGVNLNQPVVTLEEQLEKVQNDPELTEEERQKHIEKIEYLISVRDGTYAEPFALSPNFNRFLDVPFFEQEYKNYCGPATTLQTYKFFKKYSVLNQAAIANEFNMVPNGGGCDLEADILNYLNKNVGTSYQVYWLGLAATNFEASTTLICNSIDNGIPPILWVKVKNYSYIDESPKDNRNVAKWPYYTNGHYLNVSGYTKYGGQMRMTDPYLPNAPGYLDDKYGTFFVTRDTVYEVTEVVSV